MPVPKPPVRGIGQKPKRCGIIVPTPARAPLCPLDGRIGRSGLDASSESRRRQYASDTRCTTERIQPPPVHQSTSRQQAQKSPQNEKMVGPSSVVSSWNATLGLQAGDLNFGRNGRPAHHRFHQTNSGFARLHDRSVGGSGEKAQSPQGNRHRCR